MFVWKKLASAKWEDAWLERLRFLGPTRLALTTLPNAKSIHIEAYALTKHEADELHAQFGGQIRQQKSISFATQNAEVREPIRIRGKLLIVQSERDRKRWASRFPLKKVLLVPAAMAFGTGEHATTAMCLRFLSDAADALAGCEWDLLDLGTGSGILAIAGRSLGARSADAFDFDPHAVRTALENVRGNGVSSISVKKIDVTRWNPERTWDVVVANLFSGLLVTAAPAIARATKPDGILIFSGILRAQEDECVRALVAEGFRIESIARRGKWVTGFARRSARTGRRRTAGGGSIKKTLSSLAKRRLCGAQPKSLS